MRGAAGAANTCSAVSTFGGTRSASTTWGSIHVWVATYRLPVDNLDSEKYQLRPRDFAAPGNLDADLRRLNRIRREQPALQRADNLRFQTSENDRVLFYTRARRGPSGPSRGDDLLVAVNLDPHGPQESILHVPLDELGLDRDRDYVVEDLLTGVHYTWRGSRAYVRLDPAHEPAHVLRVVRG